MNETILHALNLESEGRFRELEFNFRDAGDDLVKVIWFRAVMINGIAESLANWDTLYQDDVSHFMEHKDPKVSIRAYLTASHRMRRLGQIAEAKRLAEIALNLSDLNGQIQLSGESEFALGICYHENGEKFAALAIFERISKNELFYKFRRNLAHSNVCLLLWDLGHVDVFEKSLEHLPLGFDFRCRVMLAMAKGEWAFLEKFAVDGFPSSVPPNQFVQLCCDFAYYCCVVKCTCVWEEMPRWFKETLSKFDSTSTDHLGYLIKKIVTAQISPGSDMKTLDFVDSEPSFNKLSVRMCTDLLYLQLAAAVAKGVKRQDALEWFKRAVSLRGYPWRKDPLAPPLNIQTGQFEGHWRWAQSLNSHLRIAMTHLPEIKVVGTTIKSGDKHIDLSRSPASLVVLKTLVRHSGRSISKADLHTALTRSSYVSSKHDARLFKLLQRLKERLDKVDVGTFWHFGQNGKIHVEQLSYESEVQTWH